MAEASLEQIPEPGEDLNFGKIDDDELYDSPYLDEMAYEFRIRS